MKLVKVLGATSEIWQVFIRDSSSTTGAGLAGLAFNSSGLTAYYHRDTDTTATAITLATMTVGTFTSSGFKEIDATNMPGWYQFCPPNAALASGAKSCAFHLKGATNMAPLPIEVQLVAINPDDSVRAGMTALPNAAAEASGGLYTRGTGAGQINQDANGRIDANVKAAAGTNVTLDANNVLNVSTKYVGGTLQTAGDIYSKVSGLTFTVANKLDANVYTWNGTAVTTPVTAGTPVVDWVPSGFRKNTAQAGAAGTITLDASASATDSFYKYCAISILSGTGAGQYRLCTAYVGATKVATVTPNWTTAPDNTSVFSTMPLGISDVETWLGVVPLALSSQQVQAVVPATQKVDVDTIKTNPVVNGGTFTFPTNATGASTTNITSATGIDVTKLNGSTTIDTFTPVQWARLVASALFGKASGLGTGTAVYRAADDSKDRVTASVDASGNRSAVTADGT